MITLRKITCDEWKHVKANERVATGFGDAEITAPAEEGYYTLYEIADNNNIHRGWKWEKETP